ncbi:hypothetical protein AB9F42_36010, partial [Rhizobium leguminosarum]
YAPGVEAAKAFLASTTIKSVHVIWKEDVRHWHPNQEWIWQAGVEHRFDRRITLDAFDRAVAAFRGDEFEIRVLGDGG